MPTPEVPSPFAGHNAGRRIGERAFSAFAALSLASFSVTGVSQLFLGNAANKSVTDVLIPVIVLAVFPIFLAIALLWWAWRGWALSPEPRWAVALRWGTAAGVLWNIVGVALISAWVVLVQKRTDPGLMPIYAFFTAPIGFVIGAVVGATRRR